MTPAPVGVADGGERILLSPRDPAGAAGVRHVPAVARPDHLERVAPLLTWSGIVFAVVGLIAASTNFWPAEVGRPDWEAAAASRTLDVLPMATVGLIVWAAGATARGAKTMQRAVAVISLLVALLILVLLIWDASDLPLAAHRVTGNERVELMRLATRGIILGVGQIAVLAGMSAMLWGWSRRLLPE